MVHAFMVEQLYLWTICGSTRIQRCNSVNYWVRRTTLSFFNCTRHTQKGTSTPPPDLQLHRLQNACMRYKCRCTVWQPTVHILDASLQATMH